MHFPTGTKTRWVYFSQLNLRILPQIERSIQECSKTMSKDRAHEWHCWKEDVDKYRLIPPPRYSLQRRGVFFFLDYSLGVFSRRCRSGGARPTRFNLLSS